MGGTKLQIVYPPGLASKFNYVNVEGALNVDMANFGQFQAGTEMTAQVFVPVLSKDGCDILTDDKSISDQMQADHTGFILVKTGGCSYQKKMRNIQQIGAQAALIQGGLYERNYSRSQISVLEQEKDKRIHDDGTNFMVHIPALLITDSDGKEIRDALLMNNNKVVMKARFETSTS